MWCTLLPPSGILYVGRGYWMNVRRGSIAIFRRRRYDRVPAPGTDTHTHIYAFDV